MPLPKNADGRLAEIVMKACAYNPKERYSSPKQMRDELEAILYSRAEAPIKLTEYINEDVPRREETPLTEETVSVFGETAPISAPAAIPTQAEDKTESVFAALSAPVIEKTENKSPTSELKKKKRVVVGLVLVGIAVLAVGAIFLIYFLSDVNVPEPVRAAAPEKTPNTSHQTSQTPPVIGRATVRYSANGGFGVPSGHSVQLDQDGKAHFRLSTATTPVRDGHLFLGWRLGNDRANNIVGAGAQFTLGPFNADIILTYYAQWAAVASTTQQSTQTPTPQQNAQTPTKTVRFDANGGTGAPANFIVNISADGTAIYTIPNDIPSRPGYMFSHWDSGSSFATPNLRLSPGGQMTVSRAIGGSVDVWTAQWVAAAEPPDTPPPPPAILTWRTLRLWPWIAPGATVTLDLYRIMPDGTHSWVETATGMTAERMPWVVRVQGSGIELFHLYINNIDLAHRETVNFDD
jgi:hypothetical protein